MGSSESSPSVADLVRTESPPPIENTSSPDQGNPSRFTTGRGGNAVGLNTIGGDGGTIDLIGSMPENSASVLNAEGVAIAGRGGNLRMSGEPTRPTTITTGSGGNAQTAEPPYKWIMTWLWDTLSRLGISYASKGALT